MWRLILCGAVLAASLTSAPLRADDAEDQAAAYVLKMKGQVARNDKLPGKPVVSVFLTQPRVKAEDLKELAAFKQLTALVIGGSQIADEDLKGLAGLSGLTELALKWGEVTDATLAALREVKMLHPLTIASAGLRRPTKPEEVTSFNLRDTKVTDAGLKELAGLQNLTAIHFGPKMTSEGFKELAAFKKLNTLALHNRRQVTNDVLAQLRKMKLLHALDLAAANEHKRPTKPEDVTSFSLSGTAVTVEGFKELAEFKNLNSLNVGQMSINDEMLATLRKLNLLHSLRQAEWDAGDRPTKAEEVLSLNLAVSKVSDVGLKELAGLKNLEKLNLMGTKVTAKGLRALGGLKNLNTLELPHGELGDEALAALREANLLHALSQASGVRGTRPTKPEEVTSLNLALTRVSDTGLNDLSKLKNMKTLILTGTKATPNGVKALQKLLPNCQITPP